MKKSALGKGLNALISDLPMDFPSREGSIAEILIKDIIVNKQQPRKVFDALALEELANSIKENGIIQPIVVNSLDDGKYQIIVGERRFRASQIAGLVTIPAIIKKAQDDQIFTWALLENIQREDLNPLEIATAYSELMERLNITQEALSQSLGKSRSSVANTLRLLKLPPTIQQDVLEGKLTEGHARSLAGLANIDEQIALRDEIIQNNLTVREVEESIKSLKKPKITTSHTSSTVHYSNFKNLETDIASSLQIKVKLLPKSEQQGKIELHYSSIDQLEKLKKILTQNDQFWI